MHDEYDVYLKYESGVDDEDHAVIHDKSDNYQYTADIFLELLK